MRIFTLNKTGQLHDTHTEDHIFYKHLGNDWEICAVMDGCSGGLECYFASTLYGKILKKAYKALIYQGKINPDFNLQKVDGTFIGKFILNQVFDDLGKTHQLLATNLEEILSTLLLLIYNTKNKTAWINISGDGVIVHNKQILEIDQNNVPDYMAYHLDTRFDRWIEQFSKTYTFENQSDISISTDGISKFFSLSQGKQRSIDPIHYLLIDDSFLGSDNMLEKKFKILEKDHGLIPYDDLGMIRIINM